MEEYQEEVQEQENPLEGQEEPQEQEQPPGFISKEKWVEMGRDPDEWRSPEEFKERGEKITNVVKQQRDEWRDKYETLAKDVQQLTAQQRQMAQRQVEEAYKRAKGEYERELSAIKAKKREAFEMSDADMFQQAEDAERQLRPPEPPKEERQQPPPDPVFDQWRQSNDWYDQDPKLRRYADAMSHELALEVQAGRMTKQQALDEISKEVKTEFGHKFGNQRRQQPSPVDTGSPGRPKKKSLRDLPQDARDACKRFVAKGIMTEDQYLRDYFGE